MKHLIEIKNLAGIYGRQLAYQNQTSLSVVTSIDELETRVYFVIEKMNFTKTVKFEEVDTIEEAIKIYNKMSNED